MGIPVGVGGVGKGEKGEEYDEYFNLLFDFRLVHTLLSLLLLPQALYSHALLSRSTNTLHTHTHTHTQIPQEP
jgi:hypothetical protein